MNEEPITEPITEDNQPATKGDVRGVVGSLEKQTNIKFEVVLTLIKDEARKTRDHFDTVA